MRERLFWFSAVILLAAAIHLAFILFIPGFEMGRKLEIMRKITKVNTLAVLEPEYAVRYLVHSDPQLVHAVCVFDLSTGPVEVMAKIPQTYWSMNIYSPRGDSIYTLNDLQADVDSMKIVIRRRVEGEDPASPGNTGTSEKSIVVSTADTDGLVVLRGLVPHGAARARIREQIAGSTCRAKTS